MNSNNIAKHLEPYVGPYRAQVLISEKLVEMSVTRAEDIRDTRIFLDGLFSNVFRSAFSFSSLLERKNAFIAAVLAETDTKDASVSFDTIRPCKEVLLEYFSEVFDPRVGPDLLKLKLEQLGMRRIEDYSKHHVPLIVHLVMRKAFDSYDDPQHLNERTEKLFVKLYGEENGPKICKTVLSVRGLFIDFLSIIFNKSIAELILRMELTKGKHNDIFMLLLSEQIRLVGQSVRTLLSGSMDAEEIDNINLTFLHYLKENGDMEKLPEDTEDALIHAGGQSQLYKLHLKHLFEEEPTPEKLIKTMEAVYEETYDENHRLQLTEFLQNMLENHKDDYFYEYKFEKKEGVWEERIADFFNASLNSSDGTFIVQSVKRNLGLGNLEQADKDDRKRFVDYALKSYFDKNMSLQKTKLFETALRGLLDAHV